MSDTEKVIKGLECCYKFGFHEDCPYDKKDPNEEQDTTCMMDLMTDALALLKEQQERLNSIVCFENGDQVRIWHCPLCKSEVRLVMKNWNVIENNLLGIKKVVERPQDIRVVTDDGRVIVLKKEIPTMVMNRKDWSDNDA